MKSFKMGPQYFPYTNPGFSEKITLPNVNKLVKPIPLQKFEINKEKKILTSGYDFIDLDKLLKKNKKKYLVGDLREIAKRLEIEDYDKKGKTELTELIKTKIGVK